METPQATRDDLLDLDGEPYSTDLATPTSHRILHHVQVRQSPEG
ncbi:MAG TPA: hypothetical protein VNL13_08325 [Sulfolobales archaeon]|nr:hypothetical protein [Sulfolobales archaeon]